MVVFSPFVLLLCTFWELCGQFLIYILLFTDQKKRKLRDCWLELEVKKVGPIIFNYREDVNLKMKMDIYGWRFSKLLCGMNVVCCLHFRFYFKCLYSPAESNHCFDFLVGIHCPMTSACILGR